MTGFTASKILRWQGERSGLIGGYIGCFVDLADRTRTFIDFGASCDNDVHEHFKYLAETVLTRGYIYETDLSEIKAYNASVFCNRSIISVTFNDDFISRLHYNLKNPVTAEIKLKNTVKHLTLSSIGEITNL